MTRRLAAEERLRADRRAKLRGVLLGGTQRAKLAVLLRAPGADSARHRLERQRPPEQGSNERRVALERDEHRIVARVLERLRLSKARHKRVSSRLAWGPLLV
eukprot:scaffold639_cov65-Phaeocystis_antarctica.AAC.1